MIETFATGLPGHIHHLAGSVMGKICEQGEKVAVAESCTGGLIAAVLTDVEGCSHGFDRGVCAYTDEAKAQLLGVPTTIIEKEGAVSHAVAKAMAEGLLARSGAALWISTTGFAGPGGPGDQPGLVYIGLAERRTTTKVLKREYGEVARAEVRIASLEDALRFLEKALASGDAREHRR